MNRLSTARRAQIVGCLVEGMSIRSTVRVTGAAKNTVTKLLVELGQACAEYQDGALVNLPCERIECDEIWSFCHAKQKKVPEEHEGEFGYGDVWTWVAIDADTKLVPSWLVGERTTIDAYTLLSDLKSRLRGRVQRTTDRHRPYLTVVEPLFGSDGIDFAMLHKLYGNEGGVEGQRRYSPAVCTGIDKRVICGEPNEELISTSYVERHKPHHADGDAPVHPAHERLLQEGGEPGPRRKHPLHALQLLPGPPVAHDHPPGRQADQADAGDGSRCGNPRMVRLRVGGPARHPQVKLTHYPPSGCRRSPKVALSALRKSRSRTCPMGRLAALP